MKKRLLLVGFLVLTFLALAACGGTPKESNATPDKTTETPMPTEKPSELPHEHTFDSAWSYDENKHWHKATCGHDVKKDEQEHSFDGGYDAKEGILFTCTVCGKTKLEPREEEMTSDRWTNILVEINNFTIVNEKLGLSIYSTENGMLIENKQNDVITKDLYVIADAENNKYNYYRYLDNAWTVTEITSEEFKNGVSSLHRIIEYFIYSYADFNYNSSTKLYEANGGSIDSNTFITKIKIGIASDKVTSCEFTITQAIDGQMIVSDFAFSNIGTTAFEIPENAKVFDCRVTKEKWEEVFSNLDNFTLNIKRSDYDEIIKVVGNRKYNSGNFSGNGNGDEYFLDKEDELYYQYKLNNFEWDKNEIDVYKYNYYFDYEYIEEIKNRLVTLYNSNAFESSSNSYKFDVSYILVERSDNIFLEGLEVSFENNELKSIKCSVGIVDYFFDYLFTDFDKTVIDLPTNLHQHTFKDTWSYDVEKHWKEPTCSHEVIGELADHTFNNGVCSVCGYISYSYDFTLSSDNSYYILTRFRQDGKNMLPLSIIIPSSYQDLPVKEIGKAAFGGNDYITSVIIPGSVTTIAAGAFENCSNLEIVIIPNVVTTIAASAFENCSKLENVIIPDSVNTLGYSAFNSCTNLKSVTIGKSLKSISDYAFSGCQNLEKLIIGSNVEEIGVYAFQNCKALNKVEIPAGIKKILGNPFVGCENIESIVINGENSIYRVVDNCLIDIENKALITGLTTSIIPSDGSVTIISQEAFCNNKLIKEIEIPSEINQINMNAFAFCDNLTRINIQGIIESINLSAFVGCYNVEFIQIASGNELLRSSNNCLIYNKVIILGGKNAVIPHDENVKIIGKWAFALNLATNIVIPDNIKTIENNAFYECKNLKSIDLSGVTTIGSTVFGNCTSLESIIVPNCADSSLLQGCTSIKRIIYSEGIKSIDWFTPIVSNDALLEIAVIPKSVTKIQTSFGNDNTKFFYAGTSEDWNNLVENEIKNRDIYFFSEEKPTVEGKFWHYVENNPTEW